MADSGSGEKKSAFGFLGKKIGPVPIWVIAVVLVAGYYWYENYGPGAQKKAQQQLAEQQVALAAANQEIADLRSQKSGAPNEDEDNPKSGPAGPAGPPGPPGPAGPPSRRDHHERGRMPPSPEHEPPPTNQPEAVPMTRWRAAA